MKLDQAAFARMLHIGRTYLSNIETGREPSNLLKELFFAIENDYYRRGLPIESEASPAGSPRHQYETPIESELSPFRMREEPPNITPRERLKKARIDAGYTVAEFAKKLGYKTVSVYQEIEDGRSNMGEKMARKAAQLLGLELESLLDGADEPPSRNSAFGTMGAVPDLRLPEGMKAKYVPLLSMAECGNMKSYSDAAYVHDGFLAINCDDPKAFGVKLSGDSMREKYEPGDVAVAYPSRTPKNGDLVIAHLEGEQGDVLFKIYHSQGDKITLTSYNPAYPPYEYRRDQFAWIYPVGQVTRNLM